MGGSSSKEDETEEEQQPLINNGIVEKEEGGFHLIELHIPTVGVGFVFIFMVALAAALFLWIRKWYKRRLRRHSRHGRQLDPMSVEMGVSPGFRPALFPDQTGMLRLQQIPTMNYMRPYEAPLQRYEPGRIVDEPPAAAPQPGAVVNRQRAVPVPQPRHHQEDPDEIAII